MKSSFLTISLTILLGVLFIVCFVLLVASVFENFDIIIDNEDRECQNLGYDKFLSYGYKEYCVKNGIKREVESQCGLNHCVIVLK